MTHDAFVKKWNGRYLDFDNFAGAQCVDLMRFYCKEVLNVPQPKPVGRLGAKALWDTYNPKYFDRFVNTPNAIAKKGDILIWNRFVPGITGYAGHVAMFDTGDLYKVIDFGQNWPTGTPCHLQKHSYRGIIGWLRAKK